MIQRKDLILFSYLHPRFLTVVEQIAINSKSNGRAPVILDTTKLISSGKRSHNKVILELARHKFPKIDLQKYFEQKEIEYILLPPTKEKQDSILTNVKISKSLESALVTYYRCVDPLANNRSARSYSNKLKTEISKFAHSFENYLQENFEEIKNVYIPNGRFPDQRAAHIISEKYTKTIFFYEIGLRNNSYFLQTYEPQMRIQPQLDAIKFTKKINSDLLQDSGNAWLRTRIHASDESKNYTDGHILSIPWNPKLKSGIEKKSNQKVAGIFTSSNDEFSHLSDEYFGHKWESQFAAIEFLVYFLISNGYKTYLRVHPNLVNKSRVTAKQELAFYENLMNKFPDLTVYAPNLFVNSYKLLEETDVCFVWQSTIGLEASALGVPVWTCSKSAYGLIADVKEALDSETLLINRDNLEWQVDKLKAMKFMYYLINRDYDLEISSSNFVTWDLDNPPFFVRVAGFLNTFPRFRMQLIASLDKVLNVGLGEFIKLAFSSIRKIQIIR